MSREPDVSLVMPVWRPHDRWLEDAVASALEQARCAVELIVVDDGNEPPIAPRLPDDERVRTIRTIHGGASAARNAGTAAARAPFIRYVDADDVLTPHGTRALLDAATDRLISHGVTVVCDEQLSPTGRTISSPLTGDVAEASLLGRFEVRHVSMLFPRHVVERAGPWDTTLTVGEDWDFVQRCVELAPVVAIADEVTLYRRHDRSATRQTSARAAARHGQRRVLEKHAARHPATRRLQRNARARLHDEWVRRAIDERAPGALVVDLVALARLRPVAATRLLGSAVRRWARR